MTCTAATQGAIKEPAASLLKTCRHTRVRPVLSGTCLVKQLYGLHHHATAQFQGLGNLLIANAIFMKSNNYFFSDPRVDSDQYERVRAINTKFNTPAPHSHLRPCNTNESHDTGERK